VRHFDESCEDQPSPKTERPQALRQLHGLVLGRAGRLTDRA
jgi:hypothetical protein